MTAVVTFRLNGEQVEARDVAPTTTLLEWLRANGRTGTKEGCAEGDCGACSVALAERDAAGVARWRAVNSCLTLLPMVAGREVLTVEGVAKGTEPHPVQRAMSECYGSQCGFCTPGFILSLVEAYHRDDVTTPEALDEQLCGNLCRCTGYRPIREAAKRALAERATPPAAGSAAEALATRLQAPPSEVSALDLTVGAQRFVRPTSLLDLVSFLSREPGARLVAGATDLGLEVTQRHVRHPLLVSVEGVPELQALRRHDEELVIGAAVPLTRLMEALGPDLPALYEMLRWFGSRQIRNRGTLGGNLANASPIGDTAPVLLAYGARVELASAAGLREVPLDRFFLAYRKTALAPGELIVRVRVPLRPEAPAVRRLEAAYKVSRRKEMDISIVAGAFVIDLDGDDVVRRAVLAYGGVAATTARAERAEAALVGRRLDEAAKTEARRLLAEAFTPISDHRGSAEYRRRLVLGLFERFLTEHATHAG